jgi:hypothetical protein
MLMNVNSALSFEFLTPFAVLLLQWGAVCSESGGAQPIFRIDCNMLESRSTESNPQSWRLEVRFHWLLSLLCICKNFAWSYLGAYNTTATQLL